MPSSRVSPPSPSTARALLSHYDANARDLPWRAAPGSAAKPDPYRVWLSEVMLQQTTVATVRPRFERFLARWPDVAALAAADEAEVLGEWAGLGYYARARNLHACAKAVAARGSFPDTRDGLRALPGVGDYTAAAVAGIAFGEPVAVIDTNVERVMARLLGIERPVAEAKAEIRAALEAIVPRDRPGDFAQAMMDLGATICRPKNPLCGECPLARDCAALASGEPTRFPARKAKRPRPHRHGTAYWTERDGSVWLVRRPARGMLGAMAALPGGAWHEEDGLSRSPSPSPSPSPAALVAVEWSFSHFTLTLRVEARREPVGEEGWWQPLGRLDEAGLPSLYRKAVAAVLALRGAGPSAA